MLISEPICCRIYSGSFQYIPILRCLEYGNTENDSDILSWRWKIKQVIAIGAGVWRPAFLVPVDGA